MKRYLRNFLEIIFFLALGYAIGMTTQEKVDAPKEEEQEAPSSQPKERAYTLPA